MPTCCCIYQSMGLDCCEISQAEDGQKMPSPTRRQGCLLVPHRGGSFAVLGDCCHRQLLVPAPALAHWALWAGGAGADAGVWRRCSGRLWLPRSQQDTGKLPRPLLSVVIETVKGTLLTFSGFTSAIARLLKVIVKGITLCPKKRLLFSLLSCLCPGWESLSSQLVPCLEAVGLHLGDTSPVCVSAIPLLPPYVIGMFQVVSLVYLKNTAFRGIILCFVSIRTLKKKKFMGGKINNPTPLLNNRVLSLS